MAKARSLAPRAKAALIFSSTFHFRLHGSKAGKKEVPTHEAFSAERVSSKDGGSHRCAKAKAHLLVGFACCQGAADAMEADSG
jgi:hypothetical protein